MSNAHPYSGSAPIPKISDFLREQRERFPDADQQTQELTARAQQAEQQPQFPADEGSSSRSGKGKTDTHPSAKEQSQAIKSGTGSKDGNRRTVKDPTTGNEVVIEDVNANFEKVVEGQTVVVPKSSLPGQKVLEHDFASPTQPLDEYKENQDVTAPPAPIRPGTTADVPIHGEKTNVLFYATPTLSLSDTVFASFEQKATTLCVGIFALILVLGRILGGGSLWALFLIAASVAGGVWYWCIGIMQEARTVDWASEKKRGEIAVSNLIPESVEWMNSLVGLVWSLVNPEMFASIADTIEDVMQASLPGLIENVRVADISQGENPIRILSFRALPDSEILDLKASATAAREDRDAEQKKAEEDGGEVYNLEVSFAYNAAATESRSYSGKTRNMHMQLVFYFGVRGLFDVPLPIWVELKGLIGTIRLRLQLSPDPPFLKTLTFTLMGRPQVSVSCVPMVEKGINVLDLPMISNFVNSSIATAANEYVAPKSMSLEIGKMLMGDDIKKETEALGILWIIIDRAIGLSKQDKRGSSDAYITIAFSKYGKPMYSTRVIVDDLNPIWRESTGILIRAEHIKAGESLSIELWDSDRMTADDMVGKIEVPLQDLMVDAGKMQKHVSKLMGEESGSQMPGELHWSVGFFGKSQFRPALKTSGKDVNLPPQLQDHPELQDDKGTLDNAEEDAVMHTPPDPLFPCGIVSITVHQIVNLELRDMTGTYGSRKNGKEYSPGMQTGENTQEEGGKLPSAYCTIALNDQLIYRTRTKTMSSKPIYNAGSERFVRDWRSAVLTVAVRDQRQREHDPLLGVVPLKLSDILQTSSEVTRWFPLDGGLGFGQIRLSVLFRSLDLTLPPQLLGWEVGTFEFMSDKITSTIDKPAKLKFRTGGSTGKIPRKNCISSGYGVEWSTTVGKHQGKLRLPVQHRYMSPVVIDIYTSSNSRKPDSHAMVWLDKIIDNERTTITVPIWATDNAQRLSQNYIEKPGDHPELHVQEIGTLTFEGRFKPGMDRDHVRFATDNDSREAFETWSACREEGIRGENVYVETNAVVDELHKQSIREMRADLAHSGTGQLEEGDEQRYIDKYGKDWRGVFERAQGQLESSAGAANRRFAILSGGATTSSRYEYDDDNYSDTSTSPGDSDDESDDSYHHVTSSQYHDPSAADHSTAGPSTQPETTLPEPEDKVKSGPLASIKNYRKNQKDMHRRHRGLMQWKPIRTLAFAKDEAKFGARKLRGEIQLKGREPDVETEV